MCLGIPGKLIEVYERDALPMGKVEFGGIVKEVCLAYTPEAQLGDYVLIHVGFAISRIDEAEAQEIFSYLEQIDEAEGQHQQLPAQPGQAATGEGPAEAQERPENNSGKQLGDRPVPECEARR